MFNKEEEKTVISMDMGGNIEPVELPKEEEIKEVVEEEKKSTVVPELMQIGPELKEDLPQVVENPTVVEPPKPRPVPTIGEVKKPEPVIEEKKEEVKEEVKEESKVEVTPTSVVKTPQVTPTPVPTPKPVPKTVPTIGEVKKPVTPTPTIGVVKKPVTPTPVVPTPKPAPTPTIDEVKKPTPQVEKPKEEDLEKTIVISKVEEKEVKEEIKEEKPVEETVDKGPSVIAEPLATEDTKKEKKKNPHFFECPPEAMPVRPLGYIMLNIVYMIPIIGLIVILAHSASYKNLNRRNYARSWLIGIILIALIIFALIYFLKVDVLGFIENLIGYKIDLQHFKFTKFK